MLKEYIPTKELKAYMPRLESGTLSECANALSLKLL